MCPLKTSKSEYWYASKTTIPDRVIQERTPAAHSTIREAVAKMVEGS
jgi:hypothetical protein